MKIVIACAILVTSSTGFNAVRYHPTRSTIALTVQAESVSSAVEPHQARRTYRQVDRVEQFARLPVWPVWNGVALWLVGRLFGTTKAAEVEEVVTGRVCPNFYSYSDTNPYIMLVHHCHTFANWDPLRFVQRTFFPEGFPAHPHRGFVTITYILHGGFVHRDSEGIKQSYGAEESHDGKHTQWLTTGRGMLHEEMFDLDGTKNLWDSSRQELFQIWLNVPSQYKLVTPHSLLLGGPDETPLVQTGRGTTLVLAGTYQGQSASAPLCTQLALFHVKLQDGATWTFDIPKAHATAFAYVRRGTLSTAPLGFKAESTTTIPTHSTAYFTATESTVQVTATGGDADFMFLSGEPIREPCVASGSMVMTNSVEIEQAYSDYQRGTFGIPWDHTLSDADWQRHVQQSQGQRRR